MTNWKAFEITDTLVGSDKIYFYLNGRLTFYDVDNEPRIIFDKGNWSINNLKGGDYIEIDLDKIADYPYEYIIDSGYARPARPATSRVSSVSRPSSSNAYRLGQGIADRLIREVNSQPPGRAEFEHRIEHRDRSPERYIYRRNN